jgi:outer membrane protein OmpA-like peptidoglycan-associated protein
MNDNRKENLLSQSDDRDFLEEEQLNNDDSFKTPVATKSNHFIDVNGNQLSKMSIVPWWLWLILALIVLTALLRLVFSNNTSYVAKSIGLTNIPAAIQGMPAPLVMPPVPNNTPSSIPSATVSKNIDVPAKVITVTPPDSISKILEATSTSTVVTTSVPVITKTVTNTTSAILLPVKKVNPIINSTACDVNSLSADIQFLTASSILTPNSIKSLNTMAKTLSQCPAVNIEVAGHTDSAGHAERHLGLSQRRADSVVNVLLKAGISGQRLAAKGYGSTKPIADNTTEDGRFKNRRVEFNIR